MRKKPAATKVSASGERGGVVSVDGPQREQLAPAAVDERTEGAGDALDRAGALRLDLRQERGQRLLAATEVGDERALVQHDPRSGRAHRSRAFAFRPRQGAAVRVGRIGRGEHHRLAHLGIVGIDLARAAEAILGARPGELRRAAARDEVTAARASGFLHRLEHVVHRGEASFDALGVRHLAGHDAVAIEQGARERGAAFGGRRGAASARRAQRPAAFASRRSRTPRPRGRCAAAMRPGRRSATVEAATQRFERVVGHLAGPDQVPQRREDLRRVAADDPHHVGEEDCAALLEQGAELGVHLAGVVHAEQRLGPRQRLLVLGEVQGDPSVGVAQRLETAPHDLARRAQQIEVRRPEPVEPRGEDLVQLGGGQGTAFEASDRLEERLRAAAPPPRSAATPR